MEYKNIAILITENCNAKCKMCCDSRGNVTGKTMSIDELNIILNNIKEINTITSIGITGGEPLLYPHLVEYIMNFEYGRKISISIKTNGFWGKDKKKAKEFISRNSNRLDAISFSYDEFHKEFIDLNSIKNLISIANEFNIETEIVGCFLNEGIKPGDILNELEEFCYLTKFVYQPVINTGAANSFKKSKFINLLNTDKHDIRCLAPYSSQLLINPELIVYPCCSQVIENTILEVGSLKQESLNEIITSIKYNKIFYTIFTEGFKPFIEFMRNNNIDYPKNLLSPCELCNFIFENDWFMKVISEKLFYENL